MTTIMKKVLLTLFMTLSALALMAQEDVPVVPDYMDYEDYDEMQLFEVDNAVDFIKALGSNRQITIAENITINLSNVLGSETLFYEDNRRRTYDIDQLVTDGETIVSEEVEEGEYQLVLMNVERLYIIGKTGSGIEVDSRHANLFTFKNCLDINFENLNLGHSESKGLEKCYGSVINMENCNMVYFNHCGFFGPGLYAISALNSDDIIMSNSIVSECSDGIIDLNYCHRSVFTNCDFYDNGGGVWSYLTTDTKFRDCHFFRNGGCLFYIDRKTMVDNCEFWHPVADRCNVNLLSFDELDYIMNDERGEDVEFRDLGPR